MYISLNWIRDYVNLDGINTAELLNKFTLSVAEIEGVEEKGNNLSGVVVARIESRKPHPNSQKLSLIEVNTGSELLQVVCGAPNCDAGSVVPFAGIGANVQGLKIGKVAVAGVESFGMCCSGKELGISDNHDGLLLLPFDTPLGADIKQVLPIDDTVFEVDNKSLTNRPDLWGHYGIAREIAALVGRPLKRVETANLKNYEKAPALEIEVTAPECYRYMGLTVENITAKTSNLVLQTRLYYAGMRPINLLTDLTNYLMLELGQPMHAFDQKKVKNIQVKNVSKPTEFLTLDGQARTLPAGTMVIASDQNPVAIAGIMGGQHSGTSDATTSVLIESANFSAVAVRKTATALGLRSESSSRYEKTLDPENTEVALARYLHLLLLHDSGARVTGRATDVYNKKYESVTIKTSKAFIDKYVGISIPEAQIISILESLEFVVRTNGNGQLEVDVPSFRATKDVSIPADLVEEVTRIYGYDNITPASTAAVINTVKNDDFISKEYRAKYLLASKFNFNEVHSYLWYDTQTNAALGINPPSVVSLVNALQKENSQLRQTIIPSLLRFVLENKNAYDEFGIFEIGRTAQSIKPDGQVQELSKLGLAFYQKIGNLSDVLTKVKTAAEFLITHELNLEFSLKPAIPTQDYYHPVNAYHLFANGEHVGEIATLHPVVKNAISSTAEVAVCEINFTHLCDLKPASVKFKKLTKYPVSEFDYSFVATKNTLAGELITLANNFTTPLNYEVSFESVFEPNATEKIITLKVKVWSQTHTLTGAELDEFYAGMKQHFENHNFFIKTV